jgi:hypothetical protein
MKDKAKFAPSELSRRSVLKDGLACAAGATSILAINTNMAMANQLPPTAVDYRPTPKDGKKCSACVEFDPPNACKKVSGVINPDGWCLLWKAK